MKLERKGKQLFLILIYFFISVLNGKAQSNMVFYPFESQINSPNLNPAFLTSQNKFTLGVFPMSGMNVGYNNQLVIKNMLFKILNGNYTSDDFKDVFNSMVKLDLFYQRMENNILTMGYNSAFGSFDFRIRENMQLMTKLKGDFPEIVINTSQLTMSSEKQQIFPALALYYREFSFGYAKEIIKEKLSVGVRAKLYFGKSSMVSDVSGAVARSGANSIELQTHGLLKISTPLQIITDQGVLSAVELSKGFTLTNYLMNPNNMGVGFDIGINYKLTPDFVISASLVDMGSIKWKNNLNTMSFIGSGSIIFNQANSTRIDDFSQLYKIEQPNSLPFSTLLPTTLYAGLKYRVDSKLNISLLNRYVSVNSMSFNSTSLTGVYDLKNNLTVSAGYSIIGNAYFNIPFALIYSNNAGQYYIGTDNLFSLVIPSSSDFSGITFGMCFFLFRNKTKYKESDYLPFYKRRKVVSVNSTGLIR